MRWIASASAVILAVTACTDSSPVPDQATTATSLPVAGSQPQHEVEFDDRSSGNEHDLPQAILPEGLGPVPHDVEPGAVAAGVAPSSLVASNQFWSSLLLESGPRRLWLQPLAVDIRNDGIELSAPRVVAEGPAAVSHYEPAIRIGSELSAHRVIDAGDFSVTVELDVDGSALTSTLAEGHPTAAFTSNGGPFSLRILRDSTIQADGRRLEPLDDVITARLDADLGDQTWHITSSTPVQWRREGPQLRADLAAGSTIAVTIQPLGPVQGWDEMLLAHAANPLTSTSAVTRLEGDRVVQELGWGRSSPGSSYTLLLPHQRGTATRLDGSPLEVLGSYEIARGQAVLVAVDGIRWWAPRPTAPLTLPRFSVPAETVPLLTAALERDLLRGLRPGSYFGSTDLAALAIAVDLLAAADVRLTVEAQALADELLSRVSNGVSDKLLYDGAADDRWVAHEPTWNRLVMVPSEFGSDRSNDRHFHLGHLLNAAATVAEQSGAGALGDADLVLERLAASLLATGSPEISAVHPSEDGWVQSHPGDILDPYLGHSLADGDADSDRGNNQESSSEAANAWYGMARWASATGRDELAEVAVVRHAIEAHSARTYWFGHDAYRTPSIEAAIGGGVAGILWGDRVERNTFFSGDEYAIAGIQLVPVNLSALHLLEIPDIDDTLRPLAVIDDVNLWPDVFALTRAAVDPTGSTALVEKLWQDPDLSTFHGLTWTQRWLWPVLLAQLTP